MMGIEPMTSSLPRKCSTPELHQRKRAGDETRTRDPNLGRVMLYQLSYSRLKISRTSLKISPRKGYQFIRECFPNPDTQEVFQNNNDNN